MSYDWDMIVAESVDISAIIEIYDERMQEDREESKEELKWLLNECIYKIESIDECFIDSIHEQDLAVVFKKRVADLIDHIDTCDLLETSSYFTEYMKIKYKIRILLIQLAGVWSSSDWQSPSITRSELKEQGLRQIEQNTYMRSYGSEFIKTYTQDLINAYFDMSYECRRKIIGYLTCSGMKAMEAALISYKMIVKESFPVYYQLGFYYEGISLMESLLENVQSLSVEEIYAKLDSEDPIGCLVLDSATTWPAYVGIDLDILLKKVKTHKQDNLLFIIIDRTMASISSQLINQYGDNLPSYVVLICVESLLKYYQHGLDITNIGIILYVGSIFRIPKFSELINFLLKTLSATPDPSLVRRLPRPNRTMLEIRLSRMARNTHLIFSFFQYLQKKKLVCNALLGIDPDANLLIGKTKWVGSLLYVQLSKLYTLKDYEVISLKMVEDAPAALHFHNGTSFGFDTTRISHVFNYLEEKDESFALRISLGTYNMKELIFITQYIFHHFTRLQTILCEKLNKDQ